MIRYCFLIFSGILLFACNPRQDDNQILLNEEYLNKEIADRFLVLEKDSSFANELITIKAEVLKLEYLTKDVENISASIIKTNQYFNEAPKKYNVDTSGFVILYKDDPLRDIMNIIRKNELNLLNKIIIQRNENGGLMYTAQ